MPTKKEKSWPRVLQLPLLPSIPTSFQLPPSAFGIFRALSITTAFFCSLLTITTLISLVPEVPWLFHSSLPLEVSSILTLGPPIYVLHRCSRTLFPPLGYGIPCLPYLPVIWHPATICWTVSEVVC